jgi:hypothetical protein
MYLGSPSLAMRAMGHNARYLFCDIDPESVKSLRKAGAHIGIRVVEQDGVSTIRREAAFAGVSPSDVLVHIDPYEPHERLTLDSMTPVELAASLAGRGYRVFYWYGYDSIDNRAWARKEISRLAPEVHLWCGDVTIPSPFVHPERSGVWGCGVVLANMTATEVQVCARLGTALERISADDVVANNEPARLEFAVVQ